MAGRSNKLFELINSLSMSEKRYLTLYTRRHTIGEKNHSQIIFEAIDKGSPQNDKALRELLKGQGVFINNLSSDKNYLYRLVLRGLSEFHSESTSSLQVKSLIHQTEILFRKGLFHQSLALAEKAKSIASEESLFTDIVALSLWVARIQSRLGRCQGMEAVLTRSSDALEKLENLHAYLQIYYQMQALYLGYLKVPSPETLHAASALLKNSLLQEEVEALSNRAKIAFWETHVLHARLTHQYPKVGESAQKILKLMHSTPNFIENRTKEYFQSLTFALLFSVRYAPQHLTHVQNMLWELPQNLKKEQRLYTQKVAVLISTVWGVAQACGLLSGTDGKSKEYNLTKTSALWQKRKYLSPDEWLLIAYLHGYGLLMMGKPGEAIHWMEKVLNTSELKDAPHYFLAISGLCLLGYMFATEGKEARRLARGLHQLLGNQERIYPQLTLLVDIAKRLTPNRRILSSEIGLQDIALGHRLPVLEDDFPIFGLSPLLKRFLL